jgi:hypothetical protein
MAFDTATYIHALATAHGLTADPADTDSEELTRRAVRAELAAIKHRTQALQNWSAAVVAEHETGHEHDAAATGSARRQLHSPGQNRRNATRRRYAAQRAQQRNRSEPKQETS